VACIPSAPRIRKDVKVAKYSLNLESSEPDEIILNRHGDSVLISADDAGLWNRFLNGCKEIEGVGNSFREKIRDTGKGDTDGDGLTTDPPEADAVLEARVEYCETVVRIIDGIFGEGTLRKSYRDEYEAMPGFIPDEDKVCAFLETMTHIMEDIFGRKIKKMEQASRERMAKYIPQGHKKKGKK
jgi:hypothetical protein